jgi:hypothetical protein
MVASALLSSQAFGLEWLQNGGFETNGGQGTTPASWNKWLERGASEGAATNPGNDPAWAQHGGNWWLSVEGGNLNGGFWQQVNTTYLRDFAVKPHLAANWRSDPTSASTQWGEVIWFDAAFTPTNGTDVNTNLAGFRDGNLVNGELLLKRDTFGQPGGWNNTFGTAGSIAYISPAVTLSGNGLQFNNALTSATGTLILKAGNVGGNQGVDYDNVSLTPEPAALAMLAISSLLVARRRRHV